MGSAATSGVTDAVFRPASVAVVGASSNADSPGHDYVRSLIDFGFRGPIYPINPRATEIAGLPAYPTLAAVPGDVDYAISCVPAPAVLPLIDECRAKGVRTLHLFTGRFAETGDAGAAALERDVARRASDAGIRVIGPNCMGVYDAVGGMAFRPDLPREPGDVAFLSQSGNNSVELMLHGAARGLRFSKVVSYGNALDLSEADFLDYLADDDDTRVVGAYIEGTGDGRRLFEALRRCAGAKPVVVLKGGRTGAGSRTAASHTAALAGRRQVWSAMLRQAGAVEVSTFDDLIDMLVAFAFLRVEAHALGAAPAVGVVGGGGGRAVQSADVCEEAGLRVPKLPAAIRVMLRERAPELADWVDNPVDQSILAGSAVSGARVLEMMLASPELDGLIANVGEDWVLGRPDAVDRMAHLVGRFAEIGERAEKPIAFVLGVADSPDETKWRAVEGGRQRLTDARLAVYPSVDRAARAMARYIAHLAAQQEHGGTPAAEGVRR
ncbi:MAG: CoA-binding protein [Dehalococcoidia bacterium]|nr:CoA-binding protein [Dehalococcoidia bacterium]